MLYIYMTIRDVADFTLKFKLRQTLFDFVKTNVFYDKLII